MKEHEIDYDERLKKKIDDYMGYPAFNTMDIVDIFGVNLFDAKLQNDLHNEKVKQKERANEKA